MLGKIIALALAAMAANGASLEAEAEAMAGPRCYTKSGRRVKCPDIIIMD